MNKSELARHAAQKSGLTLKQGEEVVNAIFDTIAEALESGEKVQILGFGTFEVKDRAERTARNPRTGETIVVPQRRATTFKAGADLKQAVQS
ncbi:DNA-binding protein HU-beta [Alicyclobacillus hesperidum]|uniref:DNA-binding protein HU-beta n=1 Tax=Alicyclobacillus hesperidum TaxID=89784 RepID=A0A1H2XW94_9BACL|nr:HU family DNA-binding protein [Alicyclobacillus hesperidum]SDW97222.1 DNA-binding protein HU-beta [Alicyclobacillus hesperidum]